jgi:hypothetical protein
LHAAGVDVIWAPVSPVVSDGAVAARHKIAVEDPFRGRVRRLLILYLVVYYILVAGALATMWRSGILGHLDRAWTIMAVVVAVALGAILAVLSRE